MPAKRKGELVLGQYFKWVVDTRKGVYRADGRSNSPNVGRHSLGVRDRKLALEQVQKLDRVQAVKFGKAERSVFEEHGAPLTLEAGRKAYEDHINRPRVLGGVKPATRKRYKAVLDNFLSFVVTQGIPNWNRVDTKLVQKYASFLVEKETAYATQYLELTTIKQIVNLLIQEGHLVGGSPIHLPLAKSQGTSTYCWRPEEVKAMLELCSKNAELAWLQHVIITLACTGLRISEVASLRWTDVNIAANQIVLTDESTAKLRTTRNPRDVKTGRTRSLPIHPDLAAVLSEGKKTADGRIFHGPRGGKLKPDTVRIFLIRDVIRPLCKLFPRPAEGSSFSDGRLHSFRHYFCSLCATSGVPERVVMDWLGHADSKMVKHYFHLHDREAQRQMKRLDFMGQSSGDVVG